MPWDPLTHLCAASSPASIRGKTLKLVSPGGCWATRPLSSSMVWEGSGGRSERQPPACRQGQPLGTGRVAGGHPGTQGKEGRVVPREMLLGAAKEGLDFSLQGHGWLWRMLLLPRASKSQIVPQVCIKGQYFSTWVQRPCFLPTPGGLGNPMASTEMLQLLDKPLPGLEASLDQPPASSRLFNAGIDIGNESLQGWDPRLSCPPRSIPGGYQWSGGRMLPGAHSHSCARMATLGHQPPAGGRGRGGAAVGQQRETSGAPHKQTPAQAPSSIGRGLGAPAALIKVPLHNSDGDKSCQMLLLKADV